LFNLLKFSFERTSASHAGGVVILALLLAACNSPTPAATPAPTLAATQVVLTPITVIPPTTEAITTEATSEATEVPTAQATEEARVAAPTFDPAVNQIAFQPFLQGFNQPLFLTHAGDESGRIFVLEKQGAIRIVHDGTIVEQPFLDITGQVRSSGSEQGLLGLAFPPNFTESGYFFVNYTDVNGNTAISRFQVDGANPDVADPGSEFMVLQIEDPAPNHNGGNLVFGPDGYLWIGMGDGGGGGDTYGNGQNPATLLGKMMRIDVTSDPSVPYVIPPDNPWVNADWNGADVRDEVWAVGLRNPWRYSFDRFTGDLWIADVGQNIYEEVNYNVEGTQGGLNYGWPIMEGAHCYGSDSCDQSGLQLPVAEYDHSKGCSVTGGYVYRGSQYPVLQGVYIFGDYCSGIVWATIPNPDGSWNTTQMLDSDVIISSFGEDEQGELYVTDLSSGVIYQVTGQ
jgi:glucose/arabinose dehydrogenase